MSSIWVHAFGFTALPHVGGIFGYQTTKKEITTWYATLKKPSWCPPNWVFGPMWTTLYTGMGRTSEIPRRYSKEEQGSTPGFLANIYLQSTPKNIACYGSYLVWKELGGFTDKALIPLGLYGTQLVLNWAWTPIFFGAHKMGLAFAELLCIYGAAAATTVTWYPISRTAAYLMVPYLAWLTLASALNYRIWWDNQDKED
ncbi:translocator protein-like isoform X1 [Heterodontus francisci]|uniref:translocator protein-like isoform X1 n=1 Tax=Heterodontus francisci TaxID=7792 RepID=UPI00355C17C6